MNHGSTLSHFPVRPRQMMAALLMAGGLVSTAFAQKETKPDSPTGVFDKIAGPGGKVTFTTGKHPKGLPSGVKLKTSPNGDFQSMEATGTVSLESTSGFNLKCLKMVYDAEKGTLYATDDLVVDQDTIHATAAEMEYDLETQSVTLRGNPDVRQRSGDNETHFTGMDEFRLIKSDNGASSITLVGGDKIKVEIKPTGQEASAATPALSGSGFAGFGNDVTITTLRHGDKAPKVNASVRPDGELDIFRASGSVSVLSSTVDLRSDEFLYDAAANRVEALYNVYLKKGGIEADCGRMEYDVKSGTTRLTVNPDVRQSTGNSVLHIWNIDHFTAFTREDGSTDVDYGNPDGTAKTEYLSVLPATEKKAPTNDEPVEIEVSDPKRLPEG